MRSRRWLACALSALLACQMSLSMSITCTLANDSGLLDDEATAVETDYAEWFDENGNLTYPVTADSEGWSDMTYVEQCEACIVPSDVLEEISDDDLVTLALHYPFLIDVFAFDTYEEGLLHLVDVSNVFEEIYARGDISDALITAYEENDVDYSMIASETGDEGKKYIREKILELLLGEQWQEGYLTKEQKETVLVLQEEKTQMHKYYDPEAATTNLITETLLESVEVPFVSSLIIVDTNSFTASSSSTFTASNGAKYTSGYYTKYGTSVNCFKYESGDYSSTEKETLNEQFKSAHSGWTYFSSATKKYNCHSYCWISRLTTNSYWLNDPSGFASASSYFTSHSAGSAITAEDYIIIYNANGIAHSAAAITASSGTSVTSRMSNTTVISKFGNNGLYRTTLYDAYYFYSGTYYVAYTPK